MDIIFIDKHIEKIFSNRKKLAQEYGQLSRQIEKRMKQLESADSLADMKYLPGHCHELRENRAGELAVRLDASKRLIFTPAHNPVPTLSDGGLDWSQVTTICIIEVVDYHGN